MQNFRLKFILAALSECEENRDQLTDWEKDFIDNIKWLIKNKWSLSTHQYNTLMNIKEKII
jgi:hypothetical protein